MPRASNTEERRGQIVAGLEAVMAQHGYERATIAEIAEAAGLSPGLLHYHFATKQEILLALTEKLARVWLERAAPSAGGSDDPRTRLGRLLDAWLALDASANGQAVACWVSLSAEALRQPAVREVQLDALRKACRTLEAAVRDVLSAAKKSARESAAIAAGLMAAIEGYLQLGVLGGGIVPRASAARTLRSMAFAMLDAQPEQ